MVFNGSPDMLIDDARGHVWEVIVDDLELEKIKSAYPVISTIPSVNGWEVQVVCDECVALDAFENPKGIEPNLEHAYVHFLETPAESLNFKDEMVLL